MVIAHRISVSAVVVTTMAFLTTRAQAQAAWPQDTKNPGLVIQTLPLPANYMTMGINFMPDGRLVWATAGVKGGGEIPGAHANSAVWIVRGITGSMAGATATKVSDMMRQPAGVTIVDGVVYVSDRDGFYKINNIENPGSTSTNRTKVISWPTPDGGLKWMAGEQWHQWVATPVYHNGKFYGPYGGTIQPGGRSATPPTSSYSGAFISWNPDGQGGITKIAGGFRVPNGMTMTPTGQFFVSDNQGSWLPACSFNIIKPNKFFGHKQTPPNAPNWAEGLEYEPPTMWLVDGVHQSAGQPLYMDKGPYAGDFLIGDDNSPGLSRIALDNVGGNYNGSMFFFTGGFLNGAINRLAMHPTEAAVVVGTFLTQGDWPGGDPKPMYRITFGNTADVMEMRSIHSRQGGIEIIFSQPVNPSTAVAGSFSVNQWHVNRTLTYGCCLDQTSNITVTGAQVSNDGKRVYLALNNAGAATDRVMRIQAPGIRSASPAGGSLFHATGYFSHNFQGTAAFNPAGPGTGVAGRDPDGQFLDLAVTQRAMPGRLSVTVDMPGDYRISVHTLKGALLEEKQARGAGTHVFAAGAPGMKVLRVHRNGRTLARPVYY